MSSRYPLFDRDQLSLAPLSEREHDLTLTVIKPLDTLPDVPAGIEATARRMVTAREQGSSIVLFMGAHVIRSGVQRYILDLMERGYISALAGNGACLIHDFEFALVGATTESVARYIKKGRFGMWQETSLLNEIAKDGAANDRGLGEALGQYMDAKQLPHRESSLFYNAWKRGIPFTSHVSIGQDIVHEHPACDGAAWGKASYTDFLILARIMQGLQGGAVLSFGSAVMAPEVYLKALSMVRNVAAKKGETITDFTTLVTDLRDLPEQVNIEAQKNTAGYYFRPWKTMLVRTVADGGQGYYVRGRHDQTIPWLWTAINDFEQRRTA